MSIVKTLYFLKSIYSKKVPDIEKIEDMGLLTVKIGQHYALRVDFLDEKVCTELSKLYTHSFKSKSGDKFKKLVSSYTEDKFFENFSFIDDSPFASASIGQVHNATLKNNEKVAVKVIKENYKKKFLKDLHKLKFLFKVVGIFYGKFNKIFNPIGILDNIEDYTIRELNLLNEARGLKFLKKAYEENKENYGLYGFGFNRVYESLSSENIIVSEKINGSTFDELLNAGTLPYSKLLDLFFVHSFYVFELGEFHGDIHPGNIILGDDDKIYFVDCGAISKISENIRENLLNFFDRLSLAKYSEAAYYLNKMAYRELNGENFETFKSNFLYLYRDFTGSTISEISLTKRMMETIKLGINHGMVFDEYIFPIIKSFMYMDGMVLKCRPEAVLMDDIRIFIDKLRQLRLKGVKPHTISFQEVKNEE